MMPCRIPDIGPTVLAEWRFAFSGAGLSFPGLKDYKLIPAQNLGSIQAEEYIATTASGINSGDSLNHTKPRNVKSHGEF